MASLRLLALLVASVYLAPLVASSPVFGVLAGSSSAGSGLFGLQGNNARRGLLGGSVGAGAMVGGAVDAAKGAVGTADNLVQGALGTVGSIKSNVLGRIGASLGGLGVGGGLVGNVLGTADRFIQQGLNLAGNLESTKNHLISTGLEAVRGAVGSGLNGAGSNVMGGSGLHEAGSTLLGGSGLNGDGSNVLGGSGLNNLASRSQSHIQAGLNAAQEALAEKKDEILQGLSNIDLAKKVEEVKSKLDQLGLGSLLSEGLANVNLEKKLAEAKAKLESSGLNLEAVQSQLEAAKEALKNLHQHRESLDIKIDLPNSVIDKLKDGRISNLEIEVPA